MRSRLWALALSLVCLSACAGAQRSTMLAEASLATATSLAYRTIDGVDKIKIEQIRAEYIAGQKSKAQQDYAAYKPKIEKARSAINVAEDLLENADRLRDAATKAGGDWKNYTAYLPALVAELAVIQQTIADVKGLLP